MATFPPIEKPMGSLSASSSLAPTSGSINDHRVRAIAVPAEEMNRFQISKIAAPFVCIALIINSLWKHSKVQRYESQIKKIETNINTLNSKDVNYVSEFTKLNFLLSDLTEQRNEAQRALESNAYPFLRALFSLFPSFQTLAQQSISSSSASDQMTELHKKFPILASIGEMAIFPLSSQIVRKATWSEQKSVDPDVQKVEILVNRGDTKPHAITCHSMKATTDNPTQKTVVLFPGQCMVGLDMKDSAKWYIQHGWNVLMVTFGGYPGSDQTVHTSEASTIQDVAAVLKHLEDQGVKDIGVHGFSLGCALAMHATRLSTRVKFAFIDKPFDTVENVAANVIHTSHIPGVRSIPSCIPRTLMQAAFPKGVVVPGVKDKKGREYKTDGFNNLEKAREFTGPLICVASGRDELLSYTKGQEQTTLSEDIVVDRRSHTPNMTVGYNEAGVGHETAHHSVLSFILKSYPKAFETT